MTDGNREQQKEAVLAVLFAMGKPVECAKLAYALEISQEETEALLSEMQEEQGNVEVNFFTKEEALILQSIITEDKKLEKGNLTDKEFNDRQLKLISDYDDLLGTVVLDEKALAMENRDEAEQRIAAYLRVGQDSHTLTAQAQLERNRIIKLLRIDEVTKERLLKEDKDVKEILNGYTTKEEKDRIAKSGKEFLLTFRDMKAKLMKDPFLTTHEKALRLYRIAKPFAYEVTAYQKLYASELDDNARQQEIEDLLDRFTDLLNLFESEDTLTDEGKEDLYRRLGLIGNDETESEHRKVFGENEDPGVLDKIRKKALRIDKKEDKERDPMSEDHLDTKQVRGVYAIDRFLIKNVGKDECSPAFINKLLSLSVSERLLIYYMVQTDCLESPSAIDITFSQMKYVPDEGKLTKALTKKGFRRVFGGRPRVLWEKLEAGLEFVCNDDVTKTMKNMAAFGSKRVTAFNAINTAEATPAEAVAAAEATTAGATITGVAAADDASKLQKLEKLENNVIKLERHRDEKIKEYLNYLYDCKKAIEERDSAVIHKKSKAAIANKKAEIAANAFNILKKADLELTDAINACKGEITAYGEEDLKLEDAKKAVTDQNDSNYAKGFKRKETKNGMFVSAQAMALASRVDKIPTTATLFGSTPPIIATDISLAVSGGALTLQGCLGAISGVIGMIGLIQHMRSGIGMSDIIGDSLRLTSVLTSTVWSPTYGIANMALVVPQVIPKVIQNAENATESMSNVITKSTGALVKGTVLVSSFKAAADSVAYMQEAKHGYHLNRSKKRFDKLIKEGKLKGDDAAYAENILKLQKRNIRNKKADKAVDILVDVGTIGVSLLALLSVSFAPAIALAWGVTAVGIAVGMKIADYYLNKKKKRDSVEDYLQLDNIEGLGLPDNYINAPKEKHEEYQKLMKEHMAAELGFTSTESLYRHMMKKYAEFLYNNLFYVDGDKSKPIYVKSGYDRTETSNACYQAVKSLGLRIRYPKNETVEPKPTVAQIAAKLAG